MKLKRFSTTFAIPAVLVIFACCPAAAAPILSIVPLSSTLHPGQMVQADIDIASISDLYSFQFDIVFTPGKLSTASDSSQIFEGSFFASTGDSGFFPGTVENAVGRIGDYYNGVPSTFDTLFTSVNGVSGSGVLAYIDFTAGDYGLATLSVQNILLFDSQGNAINLASSPVSATVGVVPEPSSSALFPSGLLLLFFWRMKRTGLK